MKNRQHFKSIISIFAILPFALFLISCGGGGGGGDSSDGGGTSGIVYSGVTDQAIIDESNATDLTTESYSGGSVGSAMSDIAAGQTMLSESSSHPRLLKLSDALKDSLSQVDLTSRSGGTFAGAVYQQTNTVQGECGGSASYTVNVNEEAGTFSGNYTYNTYCYGGVEINGSVDFSGTVDANGNILTFRFSFNNLSSNIGGDSVTIEGEMSFDITSSPYVLTMTLLIRNNHTNQVHWVRNYRITIADDVDCVDIDMSGKFYHPDHGYVTLSTSEPLRLCGADDYPSSGILLVTGKDGTKARLTCHSSTTYQVEADTNGDGSYDFDTGVSNWADL